jgi:glycosyltransferase involved in cell wall biosynthesis
VKQNEPYVLWLPSWYPNKLEPYNGDFIQRHAKAASLYNNVHVIYLIKDSNGNITKNNRKETFEYGRLKETIIYYYISPKKYKFLEKIFSLLQYLFLFSKIVKQVIQRDGKPQLIHLYIAYKAGLFAFWIYLRYQIPYVISEQWTIYLGEARPNFSNLPLYVRLLVKKIFSKALSIMVVSDYLGESLQKIFSISKPILIPNVVDNNVFFFAKNKSLSYSHFVHISNLNYQKNPDDILKAFSIIKKHGYKFTLDIIGPKRVELNGLVKEYKMSEEIHFHNEMPQSELVEFIQGAEALILFSRYETFGCVIIEANACGVPVIASDITVLHENIENGVNGIFASNCDPIDLSEKIMYLIDNKDLFDRKSISMNTLDKYSFENIGKLFYNWYNQSLS